MEGKDGSPARSLLTERWMTAAIVIITLLFLSINWYYYNETRSALDTEFSIRLRALASLAAASVDPDLGETLSPELAGFDGDGSVITQLDTLASDYDLASIQVLREDGIVLLTTRPDLFPPGELYPLWNMDYKEIIRALEGSPSSTGLYRSPAGGFIKAGYAPVVPRSGKTSIVVATEADAVFLQGMSGLRVLLIVATTISLAGLAIFVLLVSKATGSLIRTRESLMHAETLASMGRMAAGIAHEVRNPLFIIRSSAENLKKEHPGDSKVIDEFIIDEVDRLNGILTDYLLFARNESTSITETDLVRLLDRSVRLVGDPGHEGKITFEMRSSVERAPFLGEEKKLQQVFLNLLLNAIQAMEGSGNLTVSLSRSRSDYFMEFLDSGPGIPLKDIEKVFEPFYTTRPTGSGLGLAIARRVVEDHGGEISIKAGENTGTVVTVRLPVGLAGSGDVDEQSSDNR
jgi:signal transduction histidine kinase